MIDYSLTRIFHNFIIETGFEIINIAIWKRAL